jgi:hypothetical protein
MVNAWHEASALMQRFARRTGLTGGAESRRHLWTDAFAVCNFIGLAEAGIDPKGIDTACRLVDHVHGQLGRYRRDDRRVGPIGGRNEAAFEDAPTGGGLRIGKPLPERRPGQLFDARLEWGRDGQYFHYLTRWMHALERLAEATEDPVYHRWAVALSAVAHDAFVVRDRHDQPRTMVWKMDTDLSRVLVESMGLHDPVDGWIAAKVLAASHHADDAERAALERQAETYRALGARRNWATMDPLGTGGLLVHAWRLWRSGSEREPATIVRLLDAAANGLESARAEGVLRGSPAQRTAFRELGLALGLRAADRLVDALGDDAADDIIRALAPVRSHRDLARFVQSTWWSAANQVGNRWREHRDINEVTLAACLAPDGYLGSGSVCKRCAECIRRREESEA